jgi:hypothetical protein
MTPERQQALARALKAAAKTPLPLPRRSAENASISAACRRAAFAIRNADPEARESVEKHILAYEHVRNLVRLPVAWVPVMPITDIEVVPDPHYANVQ